MPQLVVLLWPHDSEAVLWRCGGPLERVVTLFPGPSGTESETNKGRPCASLEEEDREDDPEAEAEAGADHHRGETAVPLFVQQGFAHGARGARDGRHRLG